MPMLVIGVGGKPKAGTPPGFLGEGGGRKGEGDSPFEPKAPKRADEASAESAPCSHSSICPFYKSEGEPEAETPRAEGGELEG